MGSRGIAPSPDQLWATSIQCCGMTTATTARKSRHPPALRTKAKVRSFFCTRGSPPPDRWSRGRFVLPGVHVVNEEVVLLAEIELPADDNRVRPAFARDFRDLEHAVQFVSLRA